MNEKEKQRAVREQLLLEVVYPAKAKVLRGLEIPFKIICSNYRFRKGDERSTERWEQLTAGHLEEWLNELIREHIGPEYKTERGHYDGYLGVTTDDFYSLVKVNQESVGEPAQELSGGAEYGAGTV